MKLFWGAVVLFFSTGILLQCGTQSTQPDRPLVVSAGTDDTVRLNEEVYLAGSASETGVGDTVFTYTWKQASGPDSAQIFSPSTQITKVAFSQTGVYRISLSVSDGIITKSDIVVYTVLDSIPFAVIKPAAGDRIVLGDSVLIKWQIATPMTQTMIDLSLDKGYSWPDSLILTNPSLYNNDTQWVWHVDPKLPPSDSCMLRVRDYNNHSYYALSGIFSLVK